MKKKKKTNQKKSKPKIDVVLASLLNLEYHMKSMIERMTNIEKALTPKETDKNVFWKNYGNNEKNSYNNKYNDKQEHLKNIANVINDCCGTIRKTFNN